MKPRGILGQAGPLMLGRAGATVLGFALPLILTRLLPQAEFGTYKQVWLVVTTAYYMLQLGLAQSLYYFIPRKDGREQVWLTQTTISLTVTGTLCAAALYAGRFLVAKQFGNPELSEFGLPMALITMFMIAGSPLEIHLTAEGKVRSAAWIIFLSDAFRVLASVVPLLLGLGLRGFFWAYVLHAFARFVVQTAFFLRHGRPRVDWPLWKEQLAYALPFGAAILLDIPQRTFHQWAVGWSVDAAAFAIYAQGCFQLPIVNLLYSPISDILQVRLAQPGAGAQRVHLFHDANLRLAAVFFPFTAGMVAAASLFIPALFTHTYDASVPIFRIAILMTPFASLPLDGTLRAVGQTKYLFRIFFWRLLVTVPVVLVGMHAFGMIGAITGHALAESVMRVAMLDKARRMLDATWREVLPWGQLGVIGAASLVACVPAVLIARHSAAGPRPFLALCAAGVSYLAVYLAAIALTPGEGGGVDRIRRVLLGHAVQASA
ncbi:MAG: lipopolysaccharide biosynthesis protein [Deltaproteobacteria bacterium]|nr:MAG: lipopolysaccharide biosynthesis protein [Deltaproteobacteria bacterium]